MNKYIFFATIMSLLAFYANAQNDTMYIMNQGNVLGKYKVSDVDSVIFYQPQQPNNFIDSRDGNLYKTVTIGNQVWMAENLKYLPSVVGLNTFLQATPFYYVYGYDGTNVADAKATSNYSTYGVLYNWTAAMSGYSPSATNPSGVQGVCPIGWHLPSDAEWTELTDYLGGANIAGGKLKEINTTHWNSPNTAATNETGFNALPGGSIDYPGWFNGIGSEGHWWSATIWTGVWLRSARYNDGILFRNDSNPAPGYSVRCVRN